MRPSALPCACPNTDFGMTYVARILLTPALEGEDRDRFIGLAFTRKFGASSGSKTFEGLTYLELVLLNVQRLPKKLAFLISLAE